MSLDQADQKYLNLDIGGVVFRTAPSTLATSGYAYWVRTEQMRNSGSTTVSIDRDGRHFHHILNHLRGSWSVSHLEGSSKGAKYQLLAECDYYMMTEMADEILASLETETKTREDRLKQVLIDLTGPQGCDGSTGPRGLNGYRGLKGANGADCVCVFVSKLGDGGCGTAPHIV
jgi:hypothetical protein